VNSMTGYASAESGDADIRVFAEIKSVNSRFLDLSINMPIFLNSLEQNIRKKCEQKIMRGKVDVFIRLKEASSDIKVEADLAIAASYAQALRQIARSLNLPDSSVSLDLLARQDGVLTVQKDCRIDAYWAALEPVFDCALNKLCEERAREGEHLKRDMEKQLAHIEACLTVFRKSVPLMEKTFKDTIVKRFNEVLGDAVDEQRVMSETAALLVKYTINEEIVRSESHIQALKKELNGCADSRDCIGADCAGGESRAGGKEVGNTGGNKASGRKIDFLCQELNREINTIGSKNQLVEIGAAVIEAKNALENLREQCRNVE